MEARRASSLERLVRSHVVKPFGRSDQPWVSPIVGWYQRTFLAWNIALVIGHDPMFDSR